MEKLTIAELKAHVYDRLALIEKLQAEIRILNEEIINQSAPAPEAKTEKVDKMQN